MRPSQPRVKARASPTPLPTWTLRTALPTSGTWRRRPGSPRWVRCSPEEGAGEAAIDAGPRPHSAASCLLPGLSSTKTHLFTGKNTMSSPSLTGCAVLRSSALAVRLGEESAGLLGPRMKSRLYLWMLIGGAWDVFRSVCGDLFVGSVEMS